MGKKQKGHEGLLKWQGGREAKKQTKTQAARALRLAPFFRHFVQWQNYTTAARSVAFWLVQIDNSSDAAFTFMH